MSTTEKDKILYIQNYFHKQHTRSSRKFSEGALQHYKDEISNSDAIKQIENGVSTDPNTTFNVLLQFLSKAKDKHFPEKTVRFNKYKHKVNEWITAGILHSIQYRDKKLKLLCPESIQYQREKLNLKAYNNILSRSIRIAKKDYFINEFEKYKKRYQEDLGHPQVYYK